MWPFYLVYCNNVLLLWLYNDKKENLGLKLYFYTRICLYFSVFVCICLLNSISQKVSYYYWYHLFSFVEQFFSKIVQVNYLYFIPANLFSHIYSLSSLLYIYFSYTIGHYVFLLGAYRALYILNWIYRSYHEMYYKHNWVVYICGIIQTCLYVDFFYYYVQRLVFLSFFYFLLLSLFLSLLFCCCVVLMMSFMWLFFIFLSYLFLEVNL